jgi:hypothetical protein
VSLYFTASKCSRAYFDMYYKFLLHLPAIIGVVFFFFAMIVAISLDIVEGLKVFEGRMHLFLSPLCSYYNVFL